MKSKKFGKPSVSRETTCVFCDSASTDSRLGPMYNFENLSFHGNCMTFSDGLYQNSNTKVRNFYGFALDDIKKELSHGRSQKCGFCRRIGATIKCCKKGCELLFHLTCALESNLTLHLFFAGEYKSYCPAHYPTCIFDAEPIVGIEKRIVVRPNCCRKQIYHFKCIKEYVLGAGKSSKCPNCNDEMEFQAFMKSNGIIPSKKLAEYADNGIESYDVQCEALVCLCKSKDGRFYHKKNSAWEIVLCRFCGSAGIHIKCGNVNDRLWTCHACTLESPEIDRLAEYADNGIENYDVQCEALECLCKSKGGRFYNKKNSDWEVVLCQYCKSAGIHIKCGNVNDHLRTCYACTLATPEIDRKTIDEKEYTKNFRNFHIILPPLPKLNRD